MAENVKPTVAESLALIRILSGALGVPAVSWALVRTLGATRAIALSRDQADARLTAGEIAKAVQALYPLIPGATLNAKLLWLIRSSRPAFETEARYQEILSLVRSELAAFVAAGGAVDPVTGEVTLPAKPVHPDDFGGSGGIAVPASNALPAIGSGTISGWAPVNFWWNMDDAVLEDGLAYMHSRGVRWFSPEMVGNAGEDVLGSPAKIARMRSRFLLTQRICRSRGIWFAPILFNDNAGDGAYSNGGVKLEKRLAQARAEIDWVAANGDKSVLSVTIVSEIQTDAGRQLEAYGLSKLVGFRIDYNGNGQPSSKPSGYSGLLCHHVCDVSKWPSKNAIWMNDCGTGIRQMNLGGDLNGVGDPSKISVKLSEAVSRGQAVFSIYGFQVKAFDKPAIDALAIGAPAAGGLDLSKVRWLHADVSKWPQTATISGAKIANGQIHFPYDKSNVWPVAKSGVGKDTNANVWAIVNIGGTWYAGTWEWLRKGQQSKPVGCLDGSKGDHFKVSPLSSWIPAPKEEFYVMVSGHARASGRNVQERSQPVKVVWP